MELAFERRGAGEPLILIHGIGHHWQSWLPVLDRLAAARTVIAVDLPGFGRSPALPDGVPYTAESLADAVEGFCGLLGVRDPHVAGNSLGGYLALELASRGTVRTATALSPAGFWSRAELLYCQGVLRAMWASARSIPPERAAMLAESPAGRALAAGVVVAHPARLTPSALIAATRALARVHRVRADAGVVRRRAAARAAEVADHDRLGRARPAAAAPPGGACRQVVGAAGQAAQGVRARADERRSRPGRQGPAGGQRRLGGFQVGGHSP